MESGEEQSTWNGQDKSRELGTRMGRCGHADDNIMAGAWEERITIKKEARTVVWGHVIQDPECQAKVVGLLRPTGSIKYCGGSKGLELS